MRLVSDKYGLNLILSPGTAQVLCVENPDALTDIVRGAWIQSQGDEGDLLLSEADKEINWEKEVEIISNPFSVDCNSKKILTKLYKEMREILNEELYEEKTAVNAEIVQLLDMLSGKMQYACEYELDMDALGLLKIYNMRIQSVQETPEDTLIDYLRAMYQICHVKLFVFFNSRSYFDQRKLQQIYEFVQYEKINILFIENHADNWLEGEKVWILDKDLCTIEVN